MKSSALGTLFVWALLCWTSPTQAQTRWDHVRRPGLQRVMDATQSARALVSEFRRPLRAISQEDLVGWHALVHAQLSVAKTELQLALQAEPNHLEGLVALADLNDLLERYPEAITLLLRARSLAADSPLLGKVLFLLGTLQTRMHQFDEAIESYSALASLPHPPSYRAFALCNLAEVFMYKADLESAINTYRECLALEPQTSSAWWGLAVAYDRSSLTLDSHQAAHNALAIDADMTRLQSPDVFFVPSYEVHYYLALGFEELGKPDRAVREWTLYLDAAGNQGAWTQRARAHLDALTRPQRVTTARRSRL